MTTLPPLRFKIIGYKGEWWICYTRKTGKLELHDYEYRMGETFTSRERAREWYRTNLLGKPFTNLPRVTPGVAQNWD